MEQHMRLSMPSDATPLLLRARECEENRQASDEYGGAVVYHTAFSAHGACTALVNVSQIVAHPPTPPLWLALDERWQHTLPALLRAYELPLPSRLGVMGHYVTHSPLLAHVSVPPSHDEREFRLVLVASTQVIVTCCDASAQLVRARVRDVQDVLQTVVMDVCARVFAAARTNLSELDALEENALLLGAQPYSVAHRVWHIRRTAAALRRVHHDSRALMEATEGGGYYSSARLCCARSGELLSSVREGAHSLLEVLLAVQNNRMQETMQTLAVVTTLFVPLTFLAGIEGMNFRYMPELDGRWSYGVFWVLVVVLVLLQLAFFRRKGWI